MAVKQRVDGEKGNRPKIINKIFSIFGEYG